MVVATGAGDGQAQEHRRGRVGDVVQNLLAALHQVAGVALVRIMPVERSGHARVRVVRPEFIARNLLLNETVVRLVGVERLNDIIAIAPGIGSDFVGFEPFTLGVARQVEPMSGPAFAVTRGSQQAVHDFVEGLRRVVLPERIDFLGCRRQANQVKGRAAYQSDFVRARREFESLRLQFGEHERVNWIPCPVRLFDLRRPGLSDFLKCPVTPFLGGKAFQRFAGRRRCPCGEQRGPTADDRRQHKRNGPSLHLAVHTPGSRCDWGFAAGVGSKVFYSKMAFCKMQISFVAENLRVYLRPLAGFRPLRRTSKGGLIKERIRPPDSPVNKTKAGEECAVQRGDGGSHTARFRYGRPTLQDAGRESPSKADAARSSHGLLRNRRGPPRRTDNPAADWGKRVIRGSPQDYCSINTQRNPMSSYRVSGAAT